MLRPRTALRSICRVYAGILVTSRFIRSRRTRLRATRFMQRDIMALPIRSSKSLTSDLCNMSSHLSMDDGVARTITIYAQSSHRHKSTASS